MKISRHVVVVLGVVVTVVSLGAAALRARQNPMANGQADGSIAGLTVEVHALRLSIEEAAKNQQQVQGVGVYLSVQKDRLLQVTARLDAARKETLAAAEQTRAKAQESKQFEAYAANPDNPERRDEYARAAKAFKAEADRLAQVEADVRSRESLAEQAVQTEEMRWNELVSRLEALIRK